MHIVHVKVILNWIEKKDSHDTVLSNLMEKENCESESIESHPIDEMLLWHKAIKRQLNETFEKIKRMYLCGDFTSRLAMDESFQFIAEICIFHRYSCPFVL